MSAAPIPLAIPGERMTVKEPVEPARLPLFPEPPPSEPYPINALGPVLAPAARAIARKVQVPDAIAGQSVLAAAALATQAHADVRLPYGQTRPLSLFVATVAASGDRKSSADNEALWPIRKHERNLKDIYEVKFESWSVATAAWKGERKRIEGDRKLDLGGRRDHLRALGPEPAPPLYPFITAPDPTVEGLIKAWVSAPASLGLFTAEGGQFVGGHGMSPEHRLKTAATLSSVWDGQPIKRVRAGDGVTILAGRRLAMHMMVQPDAAAVFFSDPLLRDQGLLSRVLLSAPDSITGTRFYKEVSEEDEGAIRAYGARILGILEAPWPLATAHPNELVPRVMELTEDAKSMWTRFHDHVEGQSAVKGNLAPVRDLAAKIAEHAARIGGVLTIVNDVDAKVVESPAMELAIKLADWYLNEAVRLMQGVRINPALVRAQQLLEWLRDRRVAAPDVSVPFRDILRLGPNPLRTKAHADEAVKILVDHGWIEDCETKPQAIRLLGVGR